VANVHLATKAGLTHNVTIRLIAKRRTSRRRKRHRSRTFWRYRRKRGIGECEDRDWDQGDPSCGYSRVPAPRLAGEESLQALVFDSMFARTGAW